jgi:hypothetical protein
VVVVVVVGGAVVEVVTGAAPAGAMVTLVTAVSPEVTGVEVAGGSTAALPVRVDGELFAGNRAGDAATPHDFPDEDPEVGPALAPPRGRQAGVTT